MDDHEALEGAADLEEFAVLAHHRAAEPVLEIERVVPDGAGRTRTVVLPRHWAGVDVADGRGAGIG
ncbi:hypothetical protein [Kitasatospora sp. NPDC004272]